MEQLEQLGSAKTSVSITLRRVTSQKIENFISSAAKARHPT